MASRLINDDILDLHGLNEFEAFNSIDKFINESLLKKKHIIKFIHGHGKGVIKNLLYNYLEECEFIKKVDKNSPFTNSGTVIVELISF